MRRMTLSVLAVAGLLAAIVQLPLGAQRASSPELEALKRLTWRSIGPANQA